MFNWFKKIDAISTSDLSVALKTKKMQLIDVRETSEYASGHIKGSRNIPLGQISSFTAPKGVRVAVICQSGMRSRRACKILKKKGLDVVNVNGGMMAWKGKMVN
ncbi:rhodanese-like domain-containing protein [Lactococcus raffinolactis]|uniref:rhodanese-like domain-containing protein n=1 Tax=Pseudolactococcus raffinolactis TaxID=1366 RepID=UPI001107CAD4|nr:rhodanese-like domain-containing protein [Lactococcus raffinolactis]TLQ13654.1 rhodanese-like domain-containing protein [Lactococcus raffinolactis]